VGTDAEGEVKDSDQKCWDAALIKIWRTSGTLWDAMSLFTTLTGKHTSECDPPLKRIPRPGMPFKIKVRVFTSSYLPKINDRLWAQDPDKDVLLLRKLETSAYDTATTDLKRDYELINAQRKIKADHEHIKLNNTHFMDRNNATDWGVVKGRARISRRKK
jgi:hypothetical protein